MYLHALYVQVVGFNEFKYHMLHGINNIKMDNFEICYQWQGLLINNNACEIWASHSGVAESVSVTGYYDV
jgi:hypothetical protein